MEDEALCSPLEGKR